MRFRLLTMLLFLALTCFVTLLAFNKYKTITGSRELSKLNYYADNRTLFAGSLEGLSQTKIDELASAFDYSNATLVIDRSVRELSVLNNDSCESVNICMTDFNNEAVNSVLKFDSIRSLSLNYLVEEKGHLDSRTLLQLAKMPNLRRLSVMLQQDTQLNKHVEYQISDTRLVSLLIEYRSASPGVHLTIENNIFLEEAIVICSYHSGFGKPKPGKISLSNCPNCRKLIVIGKDAAGKAVEIEVITDNLVNPFVKLDVIKCGVE